MRKSKTKESRLSRTSMNQGHRCTGWGGCGGSGYVKGTRLPHDRCKGTGYVKEAKRQQGRSRGSSR